MEEVERLEVQVEAKARPAKRPSPYERKKAIAARLDAMGRTAPQVAAALGCSPATIYRFRSDPDYREMVDRAAEDTDRMLSERVLGLQHQALDLLEEAMTSEGVSDDVRFRAIDKVQALTGMAGKKKGGR